MVHNFYSPVIHTLILITFITPKQEQIFLFLEFQKKIYYNFLFKIINCIIEKSLNLQ